MKTNTLLLPGLLGLLGFILVGGCSSASVEGASSMSEPLATTRSLFPAVDARAATTASGALSHVRHIVATGRATGLGFSSPESVDRATLGAPTPVYFVSGAKVLARTPGTDPHAILGEPAEMLYPVLVDGVVASQVVLARRDSGEWQLFAVGGAELAQPIDQARKALATGGHAPPVALIEMHDIGVKLLAHEESGSVTFTAFAEKNGGGLNVGDSVPAESAFAKVAALAHRTLSPMDSCSGMPGHP